MTDEKEFDKEKARLKQKVLIEGIDANILKLKECSTKYYSQYPTSDDEARRYLDDIKEYLRGSERRTNELFTKLGYDNY